jgi:CRP-like cAMP-binding protein
LLDLSENFGIPNHRGGARLTLPMRHSDLAEMVGASRARVTEHLSVFTQKHLISLRDQHLVVDNERLKGFLKESQRERLSGESNN